MNRRSAYSRIDEVRYLHSLWHIGPPSSNPNPRKPKPKPKSQPRPEPVSNNLLGPSNSSVQIQKNKKKKPKKKKNNKQADSNSNPPPVSDNPWSVEPSPEPRTGWGPFPETPVQFTRPATDEEKAIFAALQLQHKGLVAVQEFFGRKRGEEGDGEEEDSEEEDAMDEDGNGEDKEDVSALFSTVFQEDAELRDYYKKNHGDGMFCCLVCLGNKQKVNKKFKNCVALVQHSTKISKTKWMRAHRAFARAVCNVLGWDIDRLPSVGLPLDESLGHESAQGESQMGLEKNEGDDQNNNLGKELLETAEMNDGHQNCQNNNLDKELVETAGMTDEQQIDCTGSLKNNIASDENINSGEDVATKDINDEKEANCLAEDTDVDKEEV